MSTRTNIHFNHGKTICANIYRHYDGYPEGVLPDLLTFFQTLRAEVLDTRLNCAEYLAAKFLVWQAKQFAREYLGMNPETKVPEYKENHYLEFLSVAPCVRDHGDIEYIYEVDCDLLDASGFPAVRWKGVGGKFKTVYLTGAPSKAA